MWKVCSEGQSWSANSCRGATGLYDWQAALQLPQNLNASGGYAGYTDWRLPNIKELASIVELSCSSPAINVAIFAWTSAIFYWSASPYENNKNNTWGVDFRSGDNYVDSRSYTYGVRLVRGGQ